MDQPGSSGRKADEKFIGWKEQAKGKQNKMKKLMIVAAAAAMTLASEAAYQCKNECSDGNCGAVYKLAISLKTTGQKRIGAKCEECSTYRAPKTMKIKGFIWGEGNCEECSTELPENMNIWTKDGPITTDLHIRVGRIGKTSSTTVEADGDLGGPGDDWGWLKLAGFGKMVFAKSVDACDECGDVSCRGYVKSLSGGIAGWRVPFIPESMEDCGDYEYNCCADAVNDKTAAYGTWKVAYNDSLSKKLACDPDGDIANVYAFPKAAFEDGDLVTNSVDTNVEE